MFEDANVNTIQDTDEDGLAGGSITLSRDGQAVETHETEASSDLFCFTDVEPGQYTLIVSAPTGFGLTSSGRSNIAVQPGTSINKRFGAAQGVEVAAAPTASVDSTDRGVLTETQQDSDSDNSQLLQISGLIVFGLAALTLVGGIGAAFFMRRR
jgi:hypothetical protein